MKYECCFSCSILYLWLNYTAIRVYIIRIRKDKSANYLNTHVYVKNHTLNRSKIFTRKSKTKLHKIPTFLTWKAVQNLTQISKESAWIWVSRGHILEKVTQKKIYRCLWKPNLNLVVDPISHLLISISLEQIILPKLTILDPLRGA